MSFAEITTSGNIIDCSISLTGNRIVVLMATGIEVYEWDFRPRPAAAPRSIAQWSFQPEAGTWSNTRFRQILFQNENHISLLSHCPKGVSQINNYALEDYSNVLMDEGVRLDTSDSGQRGQICNIYTDADHRAVWWQTSTEIECLDLSLLSSSSAVHSYTEVVVVEGHEDTSNQVDFALKKDGQNPKHAHIFSLSRKGELFANDKLLTKGCTSFVSTNAHLIFTTSLHLLKFIHIDISDGEYGNALCCPVAD